MFTQNRFTALYPDSIYFSILRVTTHATHLKSGLFVFGATATRWMKEKP